MRTNIPGLVGGATDDTIIARVGEGIVSAIGSALTYSDVLENPDSISKSVLGKGLDSGTAFEILSIDIADLGSPVLLTLVVVIGVSHEFDIKLQNGWFGILMPSVLLGPIIYRGRLTLYCWRRSRLGYFISKICIKRC